MVISNLHRNMKRKVTKRFAVINQAVHENSHICKRWNPKISYSEMWRESKWTLRKSNEKIGKTKTIVSWTLNMVFLMCVLCVQSTSTSIDTYFFHKSFIDLNVLRVRIHLSVDILIYLVPYMSNVDSKKIVRAPNK